MKGDWFVMINNIEDMPYFYTNKEWYKIVTNQNNEVQILLTDKAPEKAKQSYEEFMSRKESRITINM